MSKLIIFMGIIALIAGAYWLKEFVKRNSMLDLFAGVFITIAAICLILFTIHIKKENDM